jgi:SAM-dependent methyltransferase
VDHEEFRAESRARWEDAAAGWEQRREAFQRGAQAVSMRMIDLLDLQPGHRIVELAAGLGDTGLLAAELVAPGGSVLITDGAEGMVEAARRRAEELGARNVEFRQMEAEWIDLPTASVDGALCRWGYMLLTDPETALRETRRILRPGRTVTLAAWTDPDANPWMTAITRSVVELGFGERPSPDEPGPFAFSDRARVEELLDASGFEDVHVEAVDFHFTFASQDEHWEHQLAMSTRLGEQVAALSPAEHTALRDAVDARTAEHLTPDGTLRLPARTWVAAASA